MKKYLVILIFILVSSSYTSAQITFQKTIGGIASDGAHFIQETFDGGYIIAGGTVSFGVDSGDAYLLKTDINANITWSKTFGGISVDVFFDVKQTSDSGYIMIGMTRSFGQGNMNILVVKTDTSGNLSWSKVYGGTIEQNGYSIEQTTDGGYILCGWTTSFTGGIYVIRLDGSGNILWTKIYGGYYDAGYHIEQTTDGGFIITGDNFNSADISLIKTDSTGNPVWAKTYGTLGGDNGFSVHQTMDGGYIVLGTSGSQDLYLIKTDSTGSLLWSKTYGETSLEQGFAVQQTTDGGYILTGGTSSFGIVGNAVYLVRTNGSGSVLWSKIFGGTGFDNGKFVQQTSDGGFIVAGATDFFGSGDTDIYLIKTDSSGSSGCNQSNPATIETTVVTNVSNQNAVYFTGGTSTVPILNMGSGAIITTLCTTVDVNEVASFNSFQISPNPSSGNFIISFEGTIFKGNVEIINILGENVHAENIFNESKKEINLKNISDGIYFVKVFDGEKYYCKKIIIEQD